jgi:hypothetical protein
MIKPSALLLMCVACCSIKQTHTQPLAFPQGLPPSPSSTQPTSLADSQPTSAPFTIASTSQPTSAALTSAFSPSLNADNSFWSEASRSRLAYQASRKFTVGFLAGLNSEVLFTNLSLQEGARTSALLYAPSFILMDELVQRYNLDAVSTAYLGALYGLWLEGLIVGSVPEAPGFFVGYVTTFWHGFITTYCAFEETENLLPRRKPGRFDRKWVIGGSIFVGAATLIFFPTLALPNYAANPIVGPIAILATGGLFTYLLHRRVRAGGHEYKPTPWMAVSLIATGFALGIAQQALAKQEVKDDPESEAVIYSNADHISRSVTYFTIEAGLLVRALKLRKAKK